MALLHFESLPPRITKGELLSLLCSTGGIRGEQVGKIDLRGTMASVEVPAGWEARLVKALDGGMLKERRVRVWSAGAGGSASAEEDHFRRLSRLVELESEAEARQTRETLGRLSPVEAERTGESLIGLVITEEDSGLGGRCILTLAKRNRPLPLPWNRLGPGTPVLLAPEGGPTTEGCRGVVCERRKEALRVAVSDPPQEADREATYRLDLSGDEVARQRQIAALERVRTARRDRLAELRDIEQARGVVGCLAG
jgi:ATP-dependent RNA/DNA helicase IGHMBP2